MKQLINGFTLVDITETKITGAVESAGNIKGRNKQRNWESTIQAIGLHLCPQNITVPAMVTESVKGHKFGEIYSGTHNIWKFSFEVNDNRNAAQQLDSDFSTVPVIIDLDETAVFPKPAFITGGINRNVYFTLSKIE